MLETALHIQLLQACILKSALSQGKKIHSFIAHRQFAFATRTTFQNKLIHMYVKCGSLVDVQKVFDHMKERDILSWNSIIAAYRKNGSPYDALKLFNNMQQTGFQPDKITFASVLPACAKMGALEQGMRVHQSIKDRGILSDVIVASALVDMYAKFGRIDKASELFDEMRQRDVISWNAMIAGFTHNGFAECGLKTFKQMQMAHVKPNSTTFASILPACAKMRALEQGTDIHQSIIEAGFLWDIKVGNALIDMYAKCGVMDKALELFQRMPKKTVVSWTAMIAGYAQNGFVEKALQTFNQMQLAGVKPDSTSFAIILRACAKMGALEKGMDIHQSIMEGELLSDVTVATALVDMYAKCGSVDKARELFERMPKRDVISWNAMIAGYAQNGSVAKSLETFKQMQLLGLKPNSASFASILSVCTRTGALEQAMEIHQHIIEGGLLSDTTVGNALIDMYAKCGSIDKAHELFDRKFEKNVVSWNTMIAGYAQNGFTDKAFDTFEQMKLARVLPNSTTFASVLRVCAKIGALKWGMDIHQSIKDRGLLPDVVVSTALVDMYAKCGSMDKACELFDLMPQRDVISWNAIITGYVQNGFVEKALETFKQMELDGVKANSTTFASVFSACAKIGALEKGMDIHQIINDETIYSDVVVVTALVDMYATCGSMEKACELFEKMPWRDVVLWTAMITGYAQNGFIEKALETFKQMQLAGVKPDSTSFASIIPACAKIGALQFGMDIHQSIIEGGLFSDITVGNALVDMYAKCGSINKAHELFDKLPERNVVSWTAMVAGYTQNGLVDKALETFKQMQLAGVKPNSTTFSSILPACAKVGALELGMDIHHSITEGGFLSHVTVATALVDMYAKCGSIGKAREVFDRMPQREVISWNAMISGYAQNGFCKDALQTFELMKQSVIYPDIVSFACVLCACSHAGLVDEGCTYFNHMHKSYCITPTVDHYVCMVDILGRAGYLEDTLNFIIKMPFKPVAVVWMCFLGACRSHMNIGLGVFTATLLFDLDPKNAATFILLSNIYAEMGMWEEVQKVRKLMKDRAIEKIPGCSWIEDHKTIHVFCVGDRSHP